MVTLRNPLDVVVKITEALSGFKELVLVGQELVRGQTPAVTSRTGGRLEGISFTAGQLLVDAGGADDLDQGIVIFHEAISKDKPSLRKLLRQSDERAGRLKRVRSTKAQKAVRLAVKAGMVLRDKSGKLTGLTPAAQRLVNRTRSREAAARNKARVLKQKNALSRLKGIT